jgi:biopolymer transport protein ExbD
MAGGGSPTPSKSGKKSLDFVVNLVPMIDLLSVLISFLLITAVWTELARINTDNVMDKSDVKPKQEQQEERKDLKILLDDKGGVQMRFTGEEPVRVERGDDLMVRFREKITEIKKRAKENQKVIVAAEDKVQYDLLIQVMDVCLDVGLKALSVGDPSAFES